MYVFHWCVISVCLSFVVSLCRSFVMGDFGISVFLHVFSVVISSFVIPLAIPFVRSSGIALCMDVLRPYFCRSLCRSGFI